MSRKLQFERRMDDPKSLLKNSKKLESPFSVGSQMLVFQSEASNLNVRAFPALGYRKKGNIAEMQRKKVVKAEQSGK
jgi:hypothetical protein